MYLTVASTMLLILPYYKIIKKHNSRITRSLPTTLRFRKNKVKGTERFSFKDGVKLAA